MFFSDHTLISYPACKVLDAMSSVWVYAFVHRDEALPSYTEVDYCNLSQFAEMVFSVEFVQFTKP